MVETILISSLTAPCSSFSKREAKQVYSEAGYTVVAVADLWGNVWVTFT